MNIRMNCPKCGAVGKIQAIQEGDYYYETHDAECQSCGNVFVKTLKYPTKEIVKMVNQKIKERGLDQERVIEKYKVSVDGIRNLINGQIVGLNCELFEFVSEFLDLPIEELTMVTLEENNEIV